MAETEQDTRWGEMTNRVNMIDFRVQHLEKEFIHMHDTMRQIQRTMMTAKSIGIGLIITTLIGPLIAHWLSAL